MNELPRYTLKDVGRKDGKDGASLWIVIHDMVYDLTDYKTKHPGGEELLEEHAGQDATRSFDESGHSSDAKRLLKSFLVGELADEDKMINRRKKIASSNEERMSVRGGRRRFLSALCGKCIA